MEDVLVWLLPEAEERERARVRRLVTALRLVRDDARARSHRIAPSPEERAWNELELLERGRTLRALEGLIHAHLDALAVPDSFLDLGSPAMGYEESWRVLFGGEGSAGRAAIPSPGVGPLEAVDRLLAAVESCGAPRPRLDFWSARSLHVAAGRDAWSDEGVAALERAEARWTELFRAARAADRPLPVQAAFLSGRVSARLERFDPRGAWELFRGNEVLAGIDARLRRRFSWSALCCGDREAARELAPAPLVCESRAPLALLELARHMAEWRALLPIDALEPAQRRAWPPRRVSSRREFGAALLGVFALGPAGDARIVLLDAAPALRSEAVQRSAERDGASRRPGEPEHALLAGATQVRRHRGAGDDERSLRGALGGRRSCALALVPIRTAGGELAGWLHVESEHHLLPTHGRMEAAARAWCAALDPPPRAPCDARASTDVARSIAAEPLAVDDPRQEFLARALTALDRRLARRRLYLIEVTEAHGLAVRGEHGGALSDWSARPGGARVVRRAAAGAAPTSFDEPDAAAGVHAEAGSGVAFPLASAGPRGAIDGLLVLESARRRDFPAPDLEALRGTVRSLAPAWRAAQLRAWHGQRFGQDLAWEPESRFVSSLEASLPGLAAASRAPLVLVGPDGVGRRTLARALHLLGGGRERALVEGWAPRRGAHFRGTRLVDLASLTPPMQLGLADELADELDGRGEERCILLSPLAPEAARDRGLLVRELERRLDPLPLEIPRLADRRDEIPALVQSILRNLGRIEAGASPCFTDEALGDLWRQDWRGQVRELASVVAQLARAHGGERLGGAEVRAGFRSRQLFFRERLASLRPRALDLVLALRTTRHKSGAWNRARAARYLGWDPDTLEARLQERGDELGEAARG